MSYPCTLCGCTEFVESGDVSGVCKTCEHDIEIHGITVEALLADPNCTGNACQDLQVTFEGGCWLVKNVGHRRLHFTWGQFGNDLEPGQVNAIRNFDGSCLKYILGNRTAVYR